MKKEIIFWEIDQGCEGARPGAVMGSASRQRPPPSGGVDLLMRKPCKKAKLWVKYRLYF